MTNPHRGELKITLAKNEYKCKLNLDSIVRIESATGSSIVKVAQKLAQGEMLLTEIVSLLTISIRGGGNDVSEKDVQKIVWEAGLVEAMTVCGEILGVALGGGPEEGNQERTGSE